MTDYATPPDSDNKNPKPTRDDVTKLLADLKYWWGERVLEQNVDYTHWTLTQQINVPSGFNIIRPATAYSVVTAAADHIAGDGPQASVPPANITEKAELRSERIEKALQASLRRFSAARAESPVRTAVINFLWAGMAVSKGPIFDKDAWGLEPIQGDLSDDDFEEQKQEYAALKRARWPFFWQMVDPRWVFPDPGTTGKKYVIVNYRRSVGEIKAQWPEWDAKIPATEDTKAAPGVGSSLGGALGGGSMGFGSVDGTYSSTGYYRDTDQVEWIEYWDTGWVVYMAGFDVLQIKEHRYGKPPFQIRSAGLGNDTGLPHERFRSLLFPVRSLLNQEIRILNQLDAIMRQHAWPQMVTPIGSTFDALMPGTVKQMQKDHIEFTKPIIALPPDLPRVLLEELQFVQQQIQQATVPAVIQGIRQTGVESGFGQNSLVAQAKVRFGPIVNALESMLEEFLADFLHCVQFVVEEKVPIWGPTAGGFVDQQLDPDDIAGYTQVVVTVNPKLPTDRANEIAIGQILLQLGAIDLDTFITDFAGYEQPEELRIKRMRDEILNQPAIKNIMMMAAVDELGLLDWLLDRSTKLGLDPGMVMQAFGIFAQNAATAGQPPAVPGAQPNTAQNGEQILSNGQPNRTINPTQQTQEAGPGAALMSGAQAARAAGAPGPGVAVGNR